jgi:hypothetical protein
VLGKLERAAEICHERNLVPVILGDLIHRDTESSISLLSRLTTVLDLFPCAPIDLDGNHGKQMFRPAEGDIEHYLGKLGKLKLVNEPGLVGNYCFDGVLVNLYGCPHEDNLPTSLPPTLNGEINLLITHHDLAFEGAYPGAKPVLEVENCNMLVNGHMHKTMPSITRGAMTAHNPGNIEPLSLDVADHEPAVWEWRPEQMDFELIRHLLPHDVTCFDLTGTRVLPSEDPLAAVESLKESQFAKLLASEDSVDSTRTTDGSVLLDDLALICETAGASPAATALLISLVKNATAVA